MKTILFPTDFSNAARNAFIYALRFAAKINANITTLHVYELPHIDGVSLPNTLREIYDSIDLEEFENYRDKVPALHEIAEAEGLGNVPVNHILEEGKTVSTILRTAKKEDVDLIIMGTKGATGLKEVFIGSVTGAVLEKASCPVLGIPENAIFDGRIDNIAMTTNFKEEEELALRKMLAFAGLFQAKIHCVNIDMKHTEPLLHKMDTLKANFAGTPNINFEVLDSTDFEETLSGFLHQKQIDVLAMLTHERKGFLERLFNYSLTKKMVYHLDTPILALPAKALEKV